MSLKHGYQSRALEIYFLFEAWLGQYEESSFFTNSYINFFLKNLNDLNHGKFNRPGPISIITCVAFCAAV